jgi:ferric-dicitrate binding protein FerR (iron transport regulator)
MENFDEQNECKKQVGMFFDQALDPQSKDAFLQKVNSDPQYQQAYQHEQNIRDNIKKLIHRPVDSTHLIQAIKNQIRKTT